MNISSPITSPHPGTWWLVQGRDKSEPHAPWFTIWRTTSREDMEARFQTLVRQPTCRWYRMVREIIRVDQVVLDTTCEAFACEVRQEAAGETSNPPLVPRTPTGTEAEVCRDIANRQAKGIAKYGTTVENNPLPLVEWLQHAYEEALDQAVYLKKAINELRKI